MRHGIRDDVETRTDHRQKRDRRTLTKVGMDGSQPVTFQFQVQLPTYVAGIPTVLALQPTLFVLQLVSVNLISDQDKVFDLNSNPVIIYFPMNKPNFSSMTCLALNYCLAM